jgi:hypothetical protein
MNKVMAIDDFDHIACVVRLLGKTIKLQDGLWELCGFLLTADFTDVDCIAALMEMYRGFGGY